MEILMVVAVALAIPAIQLSVFILASAVNYAEHLAEEIKHQGEDDEPFDLLGPMVRVDRIKK
jgi:hypothetical protein